MVLPSPRSGLSWDLCTGGKDGLHQASFGQCCIQALGGASYGCQEFLSAWRPWWGDIHESNQGVHIRSFFGLQIAEIIIWVETRPKIMVCQDGFLSAFKNFERWKFDPNVYFKQYDGNILIILLYVDDILITGSTLASIAFIKTALHDAFEMSDLGLLRQFLGLEISK